MAKAELKIITKPHLAVLSKRLRKLEAKIEDKRGLNRALLVRIVRWVGERFKKEGAHDGPRWKGLKAGGRWVGKGSKRRLDTSAQILQDTGTLRASFIPFVERNSVGIGSALNYAEAHEEGRGHLPARPMLPRATSRLLMKQLRETIEYWFDQQVKRSLGGFW